VLDGGDICFGGSTGVESVARPIAFIDSGDYTGNLLINTEDQCVIQPFRPRRASAVNGIRDATHDIDGAALVAAAQSSRSYWDPSG
jgi:hypothetical protein